MQQMQQRTRYFLIIPKLNSEKLKLRLSPSKSPGRTWRGQTRGAPEVSRSTPGASCGGAGPGEAPAAGGPTSRRHRRLEEGVFVGRVARAARRLEDGLGRREHLDGDAHLGR